MIIGGLPRKRWMPAGLRRCGRKGRERQCAWCPRVADIITGENEPEKQEQILEKTEIVMHSDSFSKLAPEVLSVRAEKLVTILTIIEPKVVPQPTSMF